MKSRFQCGTFSRAASEFLLLGFLLFANGTFAQRASSWRAFKTSDGLPESACLTVSLGAQGTILVTHPDTNLVSAFDGYSVKKFVLPESARGRIAQSAGGQLWAVTTNGLIEFRNGEWISHRIPQIAAEFQNHFADATNSIPLYAVRQSRVQFLLHDRFLEFNAEDPDHPRVEVLREASQSKIGSFTSLATARDGGLWLGGESGLLHVLGPAKDISSKSEWDQFILPQLKMQGAPQPHDQPLEVKNIRALEPGENGSVIALAETIDGRQHAVIEFDGNSWRVLGLRSENILRAWRAPNRICRAVTSAGLFQISDHGEFVQADEIPTRKIFAAAIEPNGVFWLATSDGLFRYARPLWRAPENEEAFQLPPEPQSNAKLSAGSVSFTSRNRDAWFSDERGVTRLRNGASQTFPQSEKNIPARVVAFGELTDGTIVAATRDILWAFDGLNWSSLRAGFAGINALLGARDGTLWVATEHGVHRRASGVWIENNLAEGLPSANVRQLHEDPRGRIWADTDDGLSLYFPEADSDAPRSSISGLDDENGRAREHETVVLKFNAEDRWKFVPRQRLLFSYRLDEHDWSPFSAADEISLSDLAPGKHYFLARALDRNGNIETTPARIEFTVTVPWFKEARLIVIAFCGMVVALFFAAVALNRHRRLRLSYAEVERKIAERTRELEIANRELLHSQKMNALGTIAAGIAHDFNNILSIIKGSTQIIDENLDNPQKIRTRLERIKTVVQQGAGIVEAMLGFSRGSDERSASCDPNSIVNDTLTLFGERFGREVEVCFERGENLPPVFAARDLVQQILLNFIFNAAESMTKQKRIIITTREIASLPSGTIFAPSSAKNFVAVAVKDFGCGIAPENLPRIFEPFFTTKALSTRRGTGLGLSMVYELAKKLGAGISVESMAGKGSEFTLILPVVEKPAEAQRKKELTV